MPRVSVVLPFRDCESFLTEAVASILGQAFRDFELLAVDDGSKDQSVAVIEAFARQDGRVRLLRAHGAGVAAALNVGVAESRGEYVARMDGDDVALPERFVWQVAALDGSPRVLVVGSAVEHIDRRGRVLDVAWYPSTAEGVRTVLAHGHCCLCHPATMIRREALVGAGGYRTSVPFAEDFDLWLRLARVGDLINLDRRLLRYRLHTGSVAFHRTHEQLPSLLRIAVLNMPDLDEREREQVERSTDLSALIGRLRCGADVADVFLEMVEWYVHNAAVAGEHHIARRVAARLATLAPGDASAVVERRLRQSAALVAASRGNTLTALRYIMGAGFDRGHMGVLLRAILAPPRLEVVRQEPAHTEDAAGYVGISTHEDGHHLLLRGWLPVDHGTLPRVVSVVLRRGARTASLRLVQRLDVARAVGADHLHAGFHVEATLDHPLAPGERPTVWSRAAQGRWRRLYEEGDAA